MQDDRADIIEALLRPDADIGEYRKTKFDQIWMMKQILEDDVVRYLKTGSPHIETFLQIEAFRHLMLEESYIWWKDMIETYTNSRAFSDFEAKALDESKYARTVEAFYPDKVKLGDMVRIRGRKFPVHAPIKASPAFYQDTQDFTTLVADRFNEGGYDVYFLILRFCHKHGIAYRGGEGDVHEDKRRISWYRSLPKAYIAFGDGIPDLDLIRHREDVSESVSRDARSNTNQVSGRKKIPVRRAEVSARENRAQRRKERRAKQAEKSQDQATVEEDGPSRDDHDSDGDMASAQQTDALIRSINLCDPSSENDEDPEPDLDDKIIPKDFESDVEEDQNNASSDDSWDGRSAVNSAHRVETWDDDDTRLSELLNPDPCKYNVERAFIQPKPAVCFQRLANYTSALAQEMVLTGVCPQVKSAKQTAPPVTSNILIPRGRAWRIPNKHQKIRRYQYIQNPTKTTTKNTNRNHIRPGLMSLFEQLVDQREIQKTYKGQTAWRSHNHTRLRTKSHRRVFVKGASVRGPTRDVCDIRVTGHTGVRPFSEGTMHFTSNAATIQEESEEISQTRSALSNTTLIQWIDFISHLRTQELDVRHKFLQKHKDEICWQPLWILAHAILGKVQKVTLKTYEPKFVKFWDFATKSRQSPYYRQSQNLWLDISDQKLDKQLVRAYVTARLIDVKTGTCQGDLSAINHFLKAIGGKSCYEIDPKLSSIIFSIAKTCSRNEQHHALALERHVILQLIVFLKNWIKRPPRGFKKKLASTFPDAVNLAGWLGLRTGEALGLKFDDIEEIAPDHKQARFNNTCARVIIPKCKTGTEDKPGRVVFFTEFHEGVDGCPLKSWRRLVKRRKSIKKIFHWKNGQPLSRKEFDMIVRQFMDDFGAKKQYDPKVTARLSWYTFRISLFVFLGLNCDLSVETMRTLGGWSKTSDMPAHYQSKGSFHQGIEASFTASAIAGHAGPNIDLDAFMDKKWTKITVRDTPVEAKN